MAYTYAIAPLVPANSDKVSLGAGVIRDFKNAMVERVNSFFVSIDNQPWVGKDGATLGSTFVKTAIVNGNSFANAASQGVFTFAAGVFRSWSFGADAATRGTFGWDDRSSNGSLGTTIATLDSIGHNANSHGVIAAITAFAGATTRSVGPDGASASNLWYNVPTGGKHRFGVNGANGFEWNGTLLSFIGSTSSFPALKRNAAALSVRLADDSDDATLIAFTVNLNSAGSVIWNARSLMTSPADGNIAIANNAGTAFGLLQFGGVTSAFPALKRSGTALVVRLADDSANADMTAGTASFSGLSVAGTPQFASDLNVAGVYKITNTQVLSGRKTGWAAATGTATRSTFATGSVTLSVLAEHVKALVDDFISHGAIGA